MAPAPIPQDRLVRKEVALGVIRDYEPPKDHIGLRMFAPLQDVGSDDVIFDYIRQPATGMAPARAEDAESELAGKDESVGSGRASIIDWAIKDHYSASDVQRYREGLIIGEMAGATSLPLTSTSVTDDFRRRVARDARRRRARLDNRLEWLIMKMLDTGSISYNDGNISFTVNGNRPASQQDIALPTGNLWGTTASDPIEDLIAIKEAAAPQIDYTRMLISRKALRKLYKSQKFIDALTGSNPMYKVSGWGPQAAADFIGNQVDIEFMVYDSVFTTRAKGSNTLTQTRFMREDYAILLPSQATIDGVDDAIGFGKTLTSPHPEGNWTSGYYEWEKDDRDPWGYDVGTGIKAFPVMPHLDYSTVIKVI
jgi:hypothetical protein